MANITICSDASYSSKYKMAAWACYIRTPDRRILRSGIIRDKVKGSSNAERQGLANALYIIDKAVDLRKYHLIIYCDNLYALNKVKVRRTPASKHYHRAVKSNAFYDEHIQQYLDKAISYDARHVKAHLPPEEWPLTKGNFMNDYCDRTARSLLRQEKARLKGLK